MTDQVMCPEQDEIGKCEEKRKKKRKLDRTLPSSEGRRSDHMQYVTEILCVFSFFFFFFFFLCLFALSACSYRVLMTRAPGDSSKKK